MSKPFEYSSLEINQSSDVLTGIFKYLSIYLLAVTFTGTIGFLSLFNCYKLFNSSIVFYIHIILLISAFVTRITAKWFLDQEYINVKIALVYFSDSVLLTQSFFAALYLKYMAILLQSFAFSILGSILFIMIGKSFYINPVKLNSAIRCTIAGLIVATVTDMLSIFGFVWCGILKSVLNLILILLLLAKFGTKIAKLNDKKQTITKTEKIMLAMSIFDYIFQFSLSLTRLFLMLSSYKKRR